MFYGWSQFDPFDPARVDPRFNVMIEVVVEKDEVTDGVGAAKLAGGIP